MTTRGWEITLTWRDQFQLADKPFNYEVRGTLADYKSTIDRYNNTTKNLSDYYEGMELGEIWGYVTEGLFQSQEEIDNHADQTLIQSSAGHNTYVGDVKIQDLNDDGVIDDGANTLDDHGDKKIIGNSLPRFTYSVNLSADWNNFFVSAFFQGVGKQDWYPSNECIFWGQYNRPYNNLPAWHLGNYWTEDNRDAYLPRYTGYYGPFYNGNYFANTRYLQNAAYIRLKNLQVGYTLPVKWTQKAGMQKVTVFFSGENLWTWSPLYRYTRDFDVTANIHGSDSISGVDGDGFGYPVMKSFSIGLNVTF